MDPHVGQLPGQDRDARRPLDLESGADHALGGAADHDRWVQLEPELFDQLGRTLAMMRREEDDGQVNVVHLRAYFIDDGSRSGVGGVFKIAQRRTKPHVTIVLPSVVAWQGSQGMFCCGWRLHNVAAIVSGWALSKNRAFRRRRDVMSELNRREFVAATAACAFCIFGAETEALAQSGGTVDIGMPADFPAGKISDKFLKPNGLLVVNNDGRIYAMSSRCTHKAANVVIKDGNIRCPSHGSTYSKQGTPTGGPAKAALFRFAIKLNDKGHLIVDKSKQFGEKEWDKPEASVKAS